MDRKIKIFAMPSHQSKERTSGVDFARIIQPMQHLNGFKHNGVEFEVTIYDIHKDEGADWRKVMAHNDIVFFNYTVNPVAFAHMGLAVRMNNKKMIMDIDDSLWNVMEDNPTFDVYKKGGEGIHNFTCICNEVDGITVTNNYLKNIVAHNTNKRHEKIKVFPNYIDLDLYSHRCNFKEGPGINLLHFGSTTHFKDLTDSEFEKGIDMIFKEYPNVTLTTVGAMVGRYKAKWGQRYFNAYGDTDVYAWIKYKFPGFMDNADICVVPLVDSIYNRCKSSIKFLEMSSAIKPGVYQNIRQYSEVIQNGKNGFLASTAQDWFNSIKVLIDDVQRRKDVAGAAFETVKQDWDINKHIVDYADYFTNLLTEK